MHVLWRSAVLCLSCSIGFCFFFFSSRRRHTRYWRDWSSDVCSSDLVPASDEADVGGDWYDLIPLPGGAVAVTVGDVVGHWLRAASFMGELRSAVRAFALEGHSPSALLERLNRVVREVSRDQMATVAFLVVDLERAMLSYANAGHLPPLVVRPDAPPEFLTDAGGSPIGGLPY